jgi:hypothetical protein
MINCMEYQSDSSKQNYLEIPFGWNSKVSKLRLTIINDNKTVRICKKDDNGKVYPGPEPDIKNIPKLIEALAKIYNDFAEENN